MDAFLSAHALAPGGVWTHRAVAGSKRFSIETSDLPALHRHIADAVEAGARVPVVARVHTVVRKNKDGPIRIAEFLAAKAVHGMAKRGILHEDAWAAYNAWAEADEPVSRLRFVAAMHANGHGSFMAAKQRFFVHLELI